MKRIIFLLVVVLIILAGFFIFKIKNKPVAEIQNTNIPVQQIPQSVATSTSSIKDSIQAITVIAKNLNIPWDLEFLPDGRMLVTERVGNLLIIDKEGNKKVIKEETGIHKGEAGLLGVVLHPQFSNNQFVYLYMSAPGLNGNTENRIERYRFENDQLFDKKVIIKGIPGAIYHDGGRMAFGPDGYLYITTGDATTPKIAQDLKSLGGKILRLNDDGTIPNDNPFGTEVYSYGHRNPQGLAWDKEGRLWSTEHGRSGVSSGLDEINLIVKGGNYGWPDSEGDTVKPNTIAPIRHSGAKTTWAPASAVYFNNNLLYGGLAGKTLYEAVLSGDNVIDLKSHFFKEFGRIRTVKIGPDGFIYITTSNRDGRGSPVTDDDKIIKIDPKQI